MKKKKPAILSGKPKAKRPRQWRRLGYDKLTLGEKICYFAENYCLVPEGSHLGQPIRLMPFQEKFIIAIYDNPHGTRKAYLSIARKNGKTALIAILLLAHMVGPARSPNSQIISGAMSRDQASLVHSLASKMINLNPKLSALLAITPSAKKITSLTTGIEFRAIAADGKTAHGLSPVVAILDEIGQVTGPNSEFVDAITTSQGAHDAPLLIAISTSSASDSDLFSLWIDDAIRSADPHTICHVYSADPGCDLADRSQWLKANPALGKFRSIKDMETQIENAIRMPSEESKVRKLLLNQRITHKTLWIAPSLWKEANKPIDLTLFYRKPVHLGLDLSFKSDLTAAVAAVADDAGEVHVRPFVFIPSDGLEEKAKRDRAPYDLWVRQGYLIPVPGRTIDYHYVANYLKTELETMLIASINFDRWQIEAFRQAAINEGLEPELWQPVGQGFKDFSPRIDAMETALLKGRIRHDGHPLLAMAASNAVAVMDKAGNKKLDKSATSQRIDPIVATVMACYPLLDGAMADVDISSLLV